MSVDIMGLEDLKKYGLAMKIGDEAWQHVHPWRMLARDTLGKQMVRAADSIAANISEGYGRHHIKEKRQFCHYARGSLFETKTWLRKARQRALLSEKDYQSLEKDLTTLANMLNKYIAQLNHRPKP